MNRYQEQIVPVTVRPEVSKDEPLAFMLSTLGSNPAMEDGRYLSMSGFDDESFRLLMRHPLAGVRHAGADSADAGGAS